MPCSTRCSARSVAALTGLSAAAVIALVDELDRREQPGRARPATARTCRARRTAAPCPPAGRGCTRAAAPFSVARNPVRSPISRPALPRASSAMSGFFFCGSIDEPVAYASASRTKPNSSVDHSTISSPMRERCTCVSAATNSASATKSRSETASSEFSNGRAKPSCVGDRRGIERQARTGERARAERRDVGAVEAVVPAVDVAREAPRSARADGARAAPAARAAGACTPGARSRSTPRARCSSTSCSSWMRVDLVAALAPEVQAQVERDLVVAAATGVQLGARRARDLGDAALDRGVDVFVGRRERERARPRAPPRPGRARRGSRRAPRRSSSPTRASICTCAREPARSSAASRRSNGRLTVNASSSSDGPLAEPSVPQRLPAARRSRHREPRALAARPRLGRQAPQAHEAFGVLVAERVVGVVGREVVVVQAARRAPARRRRSGPGSSRRRTSPVTCSCVELHERVERAHERRVPQAVVDQLRDPDLEPLLLPRDVALERDRLRGPGGPGSARATPGTRRPRGS